MFLRRLFSYRALRSCYSSFPLSALSVHRRWFLRFEKTIIPGHLSWVKTTAYDFNSLFYCGITVCADQPEASLPGCRILKAQYATLSPLLPYLLPRRSVHCKSNVLSLLLAQPTSQGESNLFAWYKVFRYPFPLLRIVPVLTWKGRTCLFPVVSAAFLGPLLTRPGKKESWECILPATGKKMPS